jgi:hypothetical protein
MLLWEGVKTCLYEQPGFKYSSLKNGPRTPINAKYILVKYAQKTNSNAVAISL